MMKVIRGKHNTYRQTTEGVTVSVTPIYLDEQSNPDEQQFVWAYYVRIENETPRTVQLTHRHWKITDALGKTEEVQGEGVVGEQPVIESGKAYEYVSGCPLSTESGIMVGSYRMSDEQGVEFDVATPAFSLDIPGNYRVKH